MSDELREMVMVFFIKAWRLPLFRLYTGNTTIRIDVSNHVPITCFNDTPDLCNHLKSTFLRFDPDLGNIAAATIQDYSGN